MQPIESAAADQFNLSTPEELRAYARDLGLEDKIKSTDTSDKVRGLLLAALGLAAKTTHHVRAPTAAVVRGGVEIFPSYNLSPNGVWGGRRHRIQLPRPEGTKAAKAEGFGWNGKHTYYIPYGEVANVPEPIYNILKDNKRRRSFPKRTTDNDGNTEVTTQWEFDDIAFSYLGVDPETADKAGSLSEWYQDKGPEWFEERSLRELQLIAARCEIPFRHNAPPGHNPPMFTKDDGVSALKLFFFGYPDAVTVKSEEQAA